jgi:hypothetical protein
MTLGNMRDLGVRNLVASCLNDACRHVALIDVSRYPAETEAIRVSNEAREPLHGAAHLYPKMDLQTIAGGRA